MPTIMAAAGLDVPDEVDGVAQQDLDGVSLLGLLGDPAATELHHTQYFEMMGSRSIYHEGWKATTDHISTGVLDEEELAIGSRNFAEDRWELFDLSVDFSEAIDLSGEHPERVRQLADLWTAEAKRNNVLPVSDGLVDRFGGFIPPTWPAGPSRTYRPGGGAVADESIPLLWGGFRMTAAIDSGPGTADGVIFALGDWFGGYALYAVGGVVHFTFARAADALELAAPSALAPGRHDIGVFYEIGEGGATGRMVLLVDDVEVDETAVEGTLPLALQHGGAGLRLGRDSGLPVSPRYTPPAPFTGTVHELRIDGAGLAAARPGGRGARRPARGLMPPLSASVRNAIEGGHLAHLVTLNPDGSPQVTVVWIGLDGDEVVAGHLFNHKKLRNVARDPRVAISLETGRPGPGGLDEYLVLYGTARVTEGGAPELLQELAHRYIGPDVRFPPMDDPPPGYVMRISVERVAGNGDWD